MIPELGYSDEVVTICDMLDVLLRHLNGSIEIVRPVRDNIGRTLQVLLELALSEVLLHHRHTLGGYRVFVQLSVELDEFVEWVCEDGIPCRCLGANGTFVVEYPDKF